MCNDYISLKESGSRLYKIQEKAKSNFRDYD